jgi:hypothetical protein
MSSVSRSLLKSEPALAYFLQILFPLSASIYSVKVNQNDGPCHSPNVSITVLPDGLPFKGCLKAGRVWHVFHRENAVPFCSQGFGHPFKMPTLSFGNRVLNTFKPLQGSAVHKHILETTPSNCRLPAVVPTRRPKTGFFFTDFLCHIETPGPFHWLQTLH